MPLCYNIVIDPSLLVSLLQVTVAIHYSSSSCPDDIFAFSDVHISFMAAQISMQVTFKC